MRLKKIKILRGAIATLGSLFTLKRNLVLKKIMGPKVHKNISGSNLDVKLATKVIQVLQLLKIVIPSVNHGAKAVYRVGGYIPKYRIDDQSHGFAENYRYESFRSARLSQPGSYAD